MTPPDENTTQTDALLAELDALRPLPDVPLYDSMDEKALARLASLLEELGEAGQPERAAVALFGIFERFPGCDGYGVFWSIVHALESLPNCGEEMVASVRRAPNEWNVSMVNRFLNGGETHSGDTDLMGLLREVAARPDISEEARKEVRHYVQYQTQKSPR